MRYLDRLIELCEKAKKAKPVKEFIMNDLADLRTVEKAIYVIQEVGGDPEETFDKLSAYKNTNDRACPALNAPSKVLYVGSSTTGLTNRIKQHIGDGAKGTYALHLKHWFKGEYTVNIKQYDEAREVIQLIEDELSDQLKPAFGKKGGNNK